MSKNMRSYESKIMGSFISIDDIAHGHIKDSDDEFCYEMVPRTYAQVVAAPTTHPLLPRGSS